MIFWNEWCEQYVNIPNTNYALCVFGSNFYDAYMIEALVNDDKYNLGRFKTKESAQKWMDLIIIALYLDQFSVDECQKMRLTSPLESTMPNYIHNQCFIRIPDELKEESNDSEKET